MEVGSRRILDAWIELRDPPSGSLFPPSGVYERPELPTHGGRQTAPEEGARVAEPVRSAKYLGGRRSLSAISCPLR